MYYSKLRIALIGFLAAAGLNAPVSPVGLAQAEEAVNVSERTVLPDRFVSDLLDELRRINTTAEEDAGVQLRGALLEKMAVSYLQRYLIAGDIKQAGTAEQLAQYNGLFSDYISAAIGGSIDRLVERRIDIETTTERRPGDFVVRSKVFSDAGEVRAVLDWRIRNRRGELFLTDFFVDGQSFVVERKAQFSVMVRNGGFDALLKHMKDVISDEDV